MKSGIEIIKYIKLPTMLLVFILLFFATWLIKGETVFSFSVAVGCLLILVVVLLSIFSFADYKSRENVNHIISTYQKALESISRTHTKIEKEQRGTLSTPGQIGSRDHGYGYDSEVGGTAAGE